MEHINLDPHRLIPWKGKTNAPIKNRARTPHREGEIHSRLSTILGSRGNTRPAGPLKTMPAPLEIRVHGRGGQGGVTCAKLIAALYSEQGSYVQTFGDYASERSGAPIRAYTRVGENPITNRNKVYRPNHLLVLDSALIGEEVLDGLLPGGAVLVNSPDRPDAFSGLFGGFRLGVVDATDIARRHGIGTRSVIIVNTTIVGAYARMMGLPLPAIEKAYSALGLEKDLAAAREAYAAVVLREADGEREARPAPALPAPAEVLALTDHRFDIPTPLKTGSWRTQLAEYLERPAPCNASCPAGNDVVGFIQALKTEGVEAAARILLRTQPLPSVCGRVCPAPCQSGCNRKAYDGPLNVRGLERWVGDRAVSLPPVNKVPSPRRVAVVGGGPAGLSAAYALAMLGHRASLYEGGTRLGGVLRTGIPAYRLPSALLDRDIDRIIGLGVEVRCNSLIAPSILEVLAGEYDAVIVATGLGRQRPAACPGEHLPGIEQGLRYLHRVKAGGEAPLQGHVVVIGGGNSAVDCARTALRQGAARVTLVYRRGRDEMPAIPEEIEEALEEGVELLTHRQPVAFTGESSVAAVNLAEVELGEPDADGRRRPLLTDQMYSLPCDHVLLALGQSPDLELLPVGWELRKGRIFRGETPLNVFCAGDLATGEGTVTHAIGDGRRAALSALRELGEDILESASPPVDAPVRPEEVRLSHFPSHAPTCDNLAAPRLRSRDFSEVNLGLADPGEADRCFSCGRCTGCDNCLVYCPEGIIRRDGNRYSIDLDFCKGCGICAAECPRQAMRMCAGGSPQ